VLLPANESDLRKRLEANNLSRSVYGGMVVDVEEDLQFLNRALKQHRLCDRSIRKRSPGGDRLACLDPHGRLAWGPR